MSHRGYHLSLAALTALMLAAAPARAADHHEHHAEFIKCARACADCAIHCSSCHAHCAKMVAEGKKDHVRTMHLCNDCAGICLLAQTVSARGGPLAGPICEACAKSCDQCAEACEKFPDDEHMKACARSCRDCAKACRDMLKHVAK